MARYLSRADLSRIAGKYIDQYYTRFGISKDAPEPIDPERLASAVLGLNVKMLPLCSDGSVLGLTVFQRCGFTVTLGDGTKLVEIFMPKDVVIDGVLVQFAALTELFHPLCLRERGGGLFAVDGFQKQALLLGCQRRDLISRTEGNFLLVHHLLKLRD